MPRGPFVPIPNTVRVVVTGHDIGDNRPVVWVTAVHEAPPVTTVELAAINAAVDGFLAGMSAHTNGEVQWDTIESTDLNSATGPQLVSTTTHGGSGGDAPPGLSVVIETKSASRGRSFNGRIFWPVNFTAVDPATGFVNNTEIGAIAAQWTAYETALGGLTPASFPVVVSRKLHVGTQIVSVVVRPEIGRIRRRAFG